MSAQMPRDDPSFDVGGPAGRKINEESNGFSLIKGPFSG
jgi:hypothetical protein